MSTKKHEWATFYKGRLRLTACICCGQMSLPSNTDSYCEKGNISSSPVLKAGYSLTKPMMRAQQRAS